MLNGSPDRTFISPPNTDQDGSLNLDEFTNVVKNARDLSTKYFAQAKLQRATSRAVSVCACGWVCAHVYVYLWVCVREAASCFQST